MQTGGLRCWGDNSTGELGDCTQTGSSTPRLSAHVERWRSQLGIRGQLGIGANPNALTAMQVIGTGE